MMMVRVEPIFHGCVMHPIRNGPASSIPILNENRPIHLIHVSVKKDPFPSILYSHIPVRNSRTAPPPPGGLSPVQGKCVGCGQRCRAGVWPVCGPWSGPGVARGVARDEGSGVAQ